MDKPPLGVYGYVLRNRELGKNPNRGRAWMRGRIIRSIQEPQMLYNAEGCAYKRISVIKMHVDRYNKCLAFGNEKGSIGVASTEGKDVPSFPFRHNKAVCDMSWGSDIRMFATTSGDMTCKVWDLEHQMELDSHAVESKDARVDWSAGGRMAVTNNKGITIIDLRTGDSAQRIETMKNTSVAKWNKQSGRIVHVGGLGLRTYDTRMLRSPVVVGKKRSPVGDIVQSKDGNLLFVCQPDSLQVFNSASLERISKTGFPITFPVGNIPHVSIRACICEAGDARIVAAPMYTGISLVDCSKVEIGVNPCVIRTLKAHADIVSTCEYESDQQRLISGSMEMIVWTPPKRKEYEEVEEKKTKENGRNNRLDEDDWSD